MSYPLVTKRSFDKEFAALPKDIQRRVAEAFLVLRDNPFSRALPRQAHPPGSRRQRFCASLAQASLSVMVRLKTGFPGRVSGSSAK